MRLPRSGLQYACTSAFIGISFFNIAAVGYAQQTASLNSPSNADTVSDAPITHPFEKPLAPPAPAEQKVVQSDGTTVSKPRPLQDGTPPPDDPKLLQAHIQKIRSEINAYTTPPMSLISHTKSASTYSKEINRPLCVACRGTKEWLGTAVGVKCVDKSKQIIHIYSANAGLPFGAVDYIATDSSGESAVALVRQLIRGTTMLSSEGGMQQGEQYAVCLYNPTTGKWKTLGNIPLATSPRIEPDPSRNQWSSQSYPALYSLALTTNQAVIFSGGTRTNASSACVCYDRATGASQEIPWSENIQADLTAVQVNAAIGIADKFYLASDIGLLCYDTSTKSWQRFLPNQNVLQIVLSEQDEEHASVVSSPRRSNSGQKLAVTTLSLKTGTPVGAPLPYPQTNNYNSGKLSLAPDGTLWLTYGEYFYCATPGKDEWKIVADNGRDLLASDLPKYSYRYMRLMNDNTDLLTVASVDIIPDTAVMARILLPVFSGSDMVRGEYTRQEPMRWMRQRLSRWLSPKDDGESKQVRAAIDPNPNLPHSFIADPLDTNIAWGLQDEKLLRLPKSAVPDTFLPVAYGGFFLYQPSRYYPLSANAPVERFDLFDPVSARQGDQVPIKSYAMGVVPGAEDALYILAASGMKRYDSKSSSWKTLSRPDKSDISSFSSSLSFFHIAGSHVMLLPTWKWLFRINPGSLTVEASPLTANTENQQINGVSQLGLWSNVYNSKFDYLPLSAEGDPQGDWQHFETIPPFFQGEEFKGKEISSKDYLTSTGSVAWFKFVIYQWTNSGSRHDPVITGFDVKTKKWIDPLPIPARQDNFVLKITETADGGAFIGIPASQSAIYNYKPGATAWQPASVPPISLAQGTDFIAIPSPDGSLYLLTSNSIGVLNQQKNQWDFLPFPASLQYSGADKNELNNVKMTPTKSGVYVGRQYRGIWYWDKKRNDWKQILEPVTLSPNTPTKTSYSLFSITADANSIWASGMNQNTETPLLIRWDRRTQKSRFVRTKDMQFPLIPYGALQMVSAGSKTLFWQAPNIGSGLYLSDDSGTRLQRISDITPVAASAAPNDSNTAFLITPKSLYRYEPTPNPIAEVGPTPTPIDIRNPRLQYINQTGLSSLVITDTTAYVGSSSGVYCFDRKAETWKLLPGTESQRVGGIRREDNTLVIDTVDTTMRVPL